MLVVLIAQDPKLSNKRESGNCLWRGLIANLARNSGGFQVALNDTDFGAVRGGKDVPHR